MKRSVLQKAAILVVALMFALVSTFALAQAKQWYVQKDKRGVCSVHQLKGKTDKTIAGPFATKDEAKKAKDKECPKKEGKQQKQQKKN